MQTCRVKSTTSQVHDWVVYRLGDILGSVGHRVKIHKITPATGKESEIADKSTRGQGKHSFEANLDFAYIIPLFQF